MLASNNITLDLNDDTLDLANDRLISLTATSCDIQSISNGNINIARLTNGGNINITVGETGNIDISALNLNTDGGVIALRVDQGSIAYHKKLC